MNVNSPFGGNSETNAGKSKIVALVVAIMISLSVVSMPVAAFDQLSQVSDINADGEQEIVTGLSTDASPTAGDTIEVTASGSNIDYSDVSISTNSGSGTITNNSDSSGLDFTYEVSSEDVSSSNESFRFDVSGISSSASGDGSLDFAYNGSDGTTINSASQQFSTVKTEDNMNQSITGNVTEEGTGDAVPATVEVSNGSTGTMIGSDTASNDDGTYSVSIPSDQTDVPLKVDVVPTDGYEDVSNQFITVSSGSNETVDFQLPTTDSGTETSTATPTDSTSTSTETASTVDYEFDVVDAGSDVSEYTFDLYDSSGDQVGDSIEKTDGSVTSVSELTVGDEYTVEVTVDAEDGEGETTYTESFTTQETAEGESVVSHTLDIDTMDETQDTVQVVGDTASGWFDSLVQELEDLLGVSGNLALVLGGVVGISIVGGTVIIVFRGIKSSL